MPNIPSKSLFNSAKIYFYVNSNDGYNGRSKRLKQVWAIYNVLINSIPLGNGFIRL